MTLLTTVTDRKTGEVKIIAGLKAHRSEHDHKLREHVAKTIGGVPVSDEYSEVTTWEPRRTLRLVPTAEAKARQKAQADWDATQAQIKAEKLARSQGKSVTPQPKLPTIDPKVKTTPSKAGGIVAGFILLLTLLLASTAQAQRYTPVLMEYSTNITTSATWTPPANGRWVINCTKQASVAVSIYCKLDGAGTGTQLLTFARSVDGSNYETIKTTPVGFAANGTTAVICVTNIPTYGAGYLKLVSWANGEASQNTTNTAIYWAAKINAP